MKTLRWFWVLSIIFGLVGTSKGADPAATPNKPAATKDTTTKDTTTTDTTKNPSTPPKEPFHIESGILKVPVLTVLGIDRQTYPYIFDAMSDILVVKVRIIANEPGDKNGLVAAPSKLICYLYSLKKEQLKTITGVNYKVTNNGAEPITPVFHHRMATDVYFPYDRRLEWRHAVIVVGNETSAIAYHYPPPAKNFDGLDFPEKTYSSDSTPTAVPTTKPPATTKPDKPVK